MKTLILSLVFVLMASSGFAQAVPSSRRADANWAVAGVTPNEGIPARSTICSTLLAVTYGNGSTDATSAINSAITSCTAGQTVLLGAGDFRVDDLVVLNKSITLRGAGAGVTRLIKTTGPQRPGGQPLATWPQTQISGENEAIIRIGNSDFPHFSNGTVKTLTEDAVQGTTSVTLNNVTSLSVGGFYEVSEDQFFNGGNWATLPLSSGSANRWEVWANDRIAYSRYRLAALPSGTVTSSNASNEQFTLNSTTGLAVGDLLYITGHTSFVSSPAYDNGQYIVASIVSPGVVTLNSYPNNTPIDITTGGTGGTFVTGRAYTTFAVGPIAATGSPLEWFNRGGGHLYGEVKEISAINGNVVTFTTPFTDTYRVSHSAELALPDTAFVIGAGVESMTLNRGGRGAIDIQAAAKSWVKDVEISEWGGHGINIVMSHKIEVTGCYVHYAAWPVPGGGGYAIALENNSSEILITNSITADANKNIVANSAGAGSVVSYNYFDDSFIWYDLSWQEVSANASHFGGPHHVLFEGNRAVNFDSDFTHGSAYSHTVLRNYLVGERLSFTGKTNGRMLGLGIFQWNMSAVGNVLGTPGVTSPWVLTTANFSNPLIPSVYKIAYDPGNWDQAAEATTVSTFIDGDNYNYLTPGINNAAAASVPNSYYLGAKPAFFQTCTWPWVDATGGTKLYTLPAKARYDAGQPNDTTTDRCVGTTNRARFRIK